MRVKCTGQKGYLFPSDYMIWVFSQMHEETGVTIFVFDSSFVLGFSLIPPLRSLSDVAKGTGKARLGTISDNRRLVAITRRDFLPNH